MKHSLLVLRPSCEGWKLIDNGKPLYWFPEQDAALIVANQIAEARHAYANQPTVVEMIDAAGIPTRLSKFG